MSDGFAYLDILFFAMVAAFIAFRLRGVLGRRTGHEQRRRPGPVVRPTAAARSNDNVVPLPERPGAPPATAADERGGGIADVTDATLKAGLTQVRLSDPGFDLDQFLQGARAAFAMIVETFAKGDKAGLRPLLADAVYGEFARAIEDRERRGHSLATELVAVRGAEVTSAGMRGTHARVQVRFVSEQINVTRDAQGEVVDGDPKRIAEVVDVWTFERDTRSRDPNWGLVETGPAA
jgi:predicted lipid-binding transport protein (Tim44 family)